VADALFTFLFKYRPAAFARGDVAFEPPGPWWIVALMALIGAVLAAWFYAHAHRLPVRDRVTLASLRAAALGVLVTCLAGPILLVATAVPRRNIVAVLVDDSRSMGIADAGGGTRYADALGAFATDAGRISRALGDRFQVRVFRFSEALAPLAAGDTGHASGRQTDLASALMAVKERLAGEPLAGVVVASDGGDNAGGPLTDALLAYRSAGIPVHAVGYGAERFDRDIAVELGPLPERTLKNGTLVAEVRVRQRGLAGNTVPVMVEDNGAIVGQTELRLPKNGEATTVNVSFTLTEPGARRLRVRVPFQRGERVAENNARDALVVVDDRRERILYFEGEPRFEVKFLRHAVIGDRQLRVTTLLRTAKDKFLRLDVEDSSEVAAGFPRSRAELSRYRALVLGSVEASFFTRDQLGMIAEFVRERGGGLLVLGGRDAFTTGGYAGTPLADALPVVLPAQKDTAFFRAVRVRPTPAGRRHPALRLASDDAVSDARWDSLPPLSIVHALTDVKPGAATLLTGDAESVPYVVLATQHYGRGRSAAFNVQDSWIWQMHATIPLEDQTHETLWRQLLRWLVSEVPDQVTVHPVATVVLAGRSVVLMAEVSDSLYRPLNGAEVVATVEDPAGVAHIVPLAWSVEHDGEYRGSYTPVTDGLHQITVDARAGATLVGTAHSWVQAGDPRTEFVDAERHTALLRRVADETGGHFYEPSALDGLAEDVQYTTAGATTQQRLDLWDMPVVLLTLLVLLGLEWGYRRMRGLA
jgi:uncharacterized membrane protein